VLGLEGYARVVRELEELVPDRRIRRRELEVLAALEEWVEELDRGHEVGAEMRLDSLKALARDLDTARRFLGLKSFGHQAAQWYQDEDDGS